MLYYDVIVQYWDMYSTYPSMLHLISCSFLTLLKTPKKKKFGQISNFGGK